MEFRCHVRAGAPKSYSVKLNKLKKRVCGDTRSAASTFLEPIAYSRNAVSQSFFMGITSRDVHLN